MALRAKDLQKAEVADLNPDSLWIRRLRGRISRLRLAFKRGFRQLDSDRLARLLAKPAREGDWHTVRAIVNDWALKANSVTDKDLMERVANDLWRLGDVHGSLYLAARRKRGEEGKEWDGASLAGKTLAIERRGGDFATFFLFASTIPLALAECKKCIVLVENRLVPLYKRTFPEIDVRFERIDRASAYEEADFITSFEGAAHYLNWDGKQKAKLQPDAVLVSEFRKSYRGAEGTKLIGISWGSTNKFKETPALADWVWLISQSDARFVCLQYGDIEAVIRAFERALPGRIIADLSVNQLTDMDRFAAQVAALDGVITISNSVAHAAGSIGAKTSVLLDGQYKRTWPASGRDVPWYQSCTTLRRNSSTWRSIMKEALEETDTKLSDEQFYLTF